MRLRFGLIIFAIQTICVLAFGAGPRAEFVLRFDNEILGSLARRNIKTWLQAQYPRINLADKKLVAVTLMAKAREAPAQAWLTVNGQDSRRVQIPAAQTLRQYVSQDERTYFSGIQLRNPYVDGQGPWTLNVQWSQSFAFVKIKEAVVLLEQQRSVPQPPEPSYVEYRLPTVEFGGRFNTVYDLDFGRSRRVTYIQFRANDRLGNQNAKLRVSLLTVRGGEIVIAERLDIRKDGSFYEFDVNSIAARAVRFQAVPNSEGRTDRLQFEGGRVMVLN